MYNPFSLLHRPLSPRLSARWIWEVCLLALVYFIAAKLGLLLAIDGYTSPVWPPAGIAIATLIRFGIRLWPGVFLGAFLANLQVDGASLTALQVAIGNTLEAVAACWLIARITPKSYPLNHLHGVFLFSLAVLFAAMVSASIGVAAIMDWQQPRAWEHFAILWASWWSGDAVGALLFTPLLLAFGKGYKLPQRNLKEMLLFALATLLISLHLFVDWTPQAYSNGPFAFLPLLLLISIGYRFGIRGSVLFVLALATFATFGTLNGLGPFAYTDLNFSLHLLQIFIGSIALCSLLLCATITEREHARRVLLRFSRQLEQRVASTTADLKRSNQALELDKQQQQQLIGALQTSQARNRALFDNAIEAIILLDVGKGLLVDANAKAVTMFGYPYPQLSRMALLDLCPEHQPDGRTSLAASQEYITQAQSGQAVRFEWQHQDANGRRFPCAIALVPFPSDEGTLVRGSITDITKRLQAEDMQRLASKVFESTAEGVIVTDSKQRILQVNPAFCQISGYSAAELLGRPPALLASGRHPPAFFKQLRRQLKRTGRWQGEIWDRRKNGEVYPTWLTINAVKKQLRISHYVAQVTDITELKAKEERLVYLANYDHLTGLNNRSAFQEHLAQSIKEAERNNSTLSVLFMDLDGFKLINDSLGHDAGDQILCQVADRLRETLRASDLVARLGGDEFTLLAKGLASEAEQALLANKILAALCRVYEVRGKPIHLSVSLGLSSFPQDGADAKMLLKNADVAMYRAKEQGRNGYQFFTQEMGDRARARMTLEIDLHEAIEQQQFVLHYQPQLEVSSGLLIGLEALIRWNHPSRGLLTPGQFIDIAEQSGLIVAIGNWVLAEACRQNKAWQRQGLCHIPVAINLSARQFRDPGQLLATVTETLASTGLAATDLELELTESILVNNVEMAIKTLAQLRQLGIQLAIDDFGTGYSSLSYLKRFAADKLKIDRSFVMDLEREPGNAAIVKAIISLGHSLNMKVIAEGVETEEQRQFMKQHGCDDMQGYLISPAIPPKELPALLLRIASLR
ncbi:MAG: diguanylate cyclase (GGDEF)-like protein/PAS domain S-box-containing protein [Motiliproteus sp.]|jgi:diguanylate cyclase (GGDEF)-like protein/PAS domain S-box-containing protein